MVLDLLVDGGERSRRRARQLELPAWLQRHRGILREERDRLPVLLVLGLGTAGRAGDGVEQLADALRAVVRDRLERRTAHADLLVLDADEPAIGPALCRPDIGGELVDVGDRSR